MAATIKDLPVETLLQIFSDETFTNAELFNCTMTCKRFCSVASQCPINYTFRVDHPSRPAWKLTRALLRDPKIGERFRSIQVMWHRRNPRKLRTWTLQWKWTQEEEAKLRIMFQEWELAIGYECPVAADVIYGVNSEALLPLLLCFTPKLTSFDYGRADLYLLSPFPSNLQNERAFCYCTRSKKPDMEEIKYGRRWHSVVPCSRFHMALEDTLLPGLSNITSFTHKSHVNDDRSMSPLSLDHFLAILLLPRLQSLEIFGCDLRPPFRMSDIYLAQRQDRIRRINKDDYIPTRQSPVTRLEFIGCGGNYEQFEVIASYTGSLESIRISLVEDSPLEEGDDLLSLFLQSNRLLTEDQISIEDSPDVVGESGNENESDEDSDSVFNKLFPDSLDEGGSIRSTRATIVRGFKKIRKNIFNARGT
ncbi:hypothetical protein TWF730_005809 [Orbilia blumenaviensis]|uniref:F-box domain-containing protein n=1 Tax=Orbilia blumenaviensis TaxID=1796055 RepID=A0AAV9VKV0_9PEZI